MFIDVIPTAQHVNKEKVENKLVIVFDILRSTTCMVTALNSGAKAIYPALNRQEALQLQKALKPAGVLLAGEEQGEIIPGFDLGNSPQEFEHKRVKGKSIIMATTNGTVAIRRAAAAKEVVIGSFLNISLICDYLLQQNLDTVLVCSGTQGRFSLEDILAAGMVINWLRRRQSSLKYLDLATAAEGLYRSYQDNLLLGVSTSENGRNLKDRHQCQDLRYSVHVNAMDILPVLEQDRVILKKM